jgi:hypothetical protein
MHLTLVVPGLLDWPSSAFNRVDEHAPALSRLLRAASGPEIDEDGLVATACRACGIAKQQDWPVAPWLARGAGVAVSEAYWLCAEPARFAVSHNDVRLAELVADLATDDANALAATLNAHFTGDGIRFIVPRPARWFARVDRAPQLVTHPPEAALGAPLFPYLAAGPDAPRWRRWQSEMQMLFFEHAVNRRREQTGRPPIDGVWLWGGGTLVARDVPQTRIFAGDGLVSELARSAGLPLAPLPAGLDAVTGTTPSVFWLDAIGFDADASRLATIERAWLVPAERALQKGRIREIALVIGGRASAITFQLARPSLPARWRARFSRPRVAPMLSRWADRSPER